MDEPTSSLQRSNVERLFRLIRQLRDRGLAIVYISHFLEEVREIADRYTVLRDGRSVGSGQLAAVTDNELIAMMVGRAVAIPSRAREQSRGTAAALQIDGLTLYRGEILGLFGLIGSGRTELVRGIYGLAPARGEIRVHGTLGYVSEDRKGEGLALSLSIADNVTLPRLSACSRAGWIDRQRQFEQTADVMTRLQVKAANPEVRVSRLSGGNQQKVAVGRLLHQDPDILLLDEPARGIDIGSKGDIYREIGHLADEGKAILFVSSYLPELLAVCDRIAVMTRGRLSEARPTSEWTADTILQAAIGSESAA